MNYLILDWNDHRCDDKQVFQNGHRPGRQHDLFKLPQLV
jgi:hypothetical protein